MSRFSLFCSQVSQENPLFSMYRHYVDLYLRHKVGEVKSRGGLRRLLAPPLPSSEETPLQEATLWLKALHPSSSPQNRILRFLRPQWIAKPCRGPH